VADDMIALENINDGVGNTRMARRKYEAYRNLILEAVPGDDQGITFKGLVDVVRNRIPEEERAAMGSVTWHVTAVKLDLEARGLIQRIPKVTPQRLRKLSV